MSIPFILAAPALAQTTLAPREVPAKMVPVLDTVSPELQAVIAQPLRNGWDKSPTTPEGWTALVNAGLAATAPLVGPMVDRLHMKIEPRPSRA